MDNFDTEYGWTVGGTSPTGVWTRGEPVGTQYQNQESNPDNDVTNDTGAECYVTGNGGGQAGNDDVDDGDAILTCPPMKLAGYIDATLSFSYWFFNAGGSGTPNDQFEVRASNGSSEVILFTTNVSASGWVEVPPIHLADYITLTDNVRISFIATDDAPGHLLEAGVDKFLVQAITVGNKEIATAAKVEVSPNPTTTDFYLQYNWPGVNDVMLEVRNTLGQIVVNRPLSGEKGNGRFGENLTPGIYTVTISNGTQQSAAVKVVKN
jgi:Secretion system C-terminal sorting domain